MSVNAESLPSAAACAQDKEGASRKTRARSGTSQENLIRLSEYTRNESGFIGHGRLIFGISQKHALFGGEAHREYGDVRERTDESGNPSRVDQREGQHFREDGSVVWMA